MSRATSVGRAAGSCLVLMLALALPVRASAGVQAASPCDRACLEPRW